MILNDRALRAAKTRVSLLKQEIATSAFSDFKSQLSADTLELRRKALSEELDRIAAQIQAYERLKGSRLANDEELDTTQLGLLPILGRISKGLSQRELGELLNLKEQQIQRYEADRYSSISLSRFERILQVLGVSLTADWQNVALIEQESKDIEDVFSNTSPESLREIEKRNWFENSGLSKENKLTNLVAYALRAKKLAGGVTLHRKTVLKDRRINTAALCAWQARIVNLAQSASVKVGKRFNLADVSWVARLVSLSVHEDGPRRAIGLLLEHGIVVAIEPHLTGTYVDGAAIMLSDGVPVIGLSLRHDRLDSFWFTLLHELGHIFLHFNAGLSEGFFDDLDEVDELENKLELEANAFARSALIPDEAWSMSPARFSKTIDPIRAFAASRQISVAIVVGRIRRERKNYSLFSQYLGQGKVRSQFSL